ncbi:MAG: hypothetical protein EA363_02235 [Balneolaceae bacterium]|nr:MAG: hypothetical protein EA363_02235 [Balneolaceae bacterium]
MKRNDIFVDMRLPGILLDVFFKSCPVRNGAAKGVTAGLICLLMVWTTEVAAQTVSSVQPDSSQYIAPLTTTITSQQMEQFGTRSVRDAIVRMPGMNLGRRNELNMRGVGQFGYNVLLNGRPLAASTFDGRSFEIASVSSDIFSEIEIIRVAAPDLPADALAGTINLITYGYPPGDGRTVRAYGGVTAHPDYFTYTGAGANAGLHYSETVHENLSLSVDLSLQQDQSGFESLTMNYGAAEIENTQMDVLTRIAPGLHVDAATRWSGSARMHYEASDALSFYLKGFFFNNDRATDRHQNIMDTMGDLLRPDTTGAIGQQGFAGYNALRQNHQVRHYNVHAGGRQRFNFGKLDFDATWSTSQVFQEEYLFPFQRNGVDFTINFDDRVRPEMQITNVQLARDGTIDYRSIRFQGIDQTITGQDNELYSANLDLRIPHHHGTVAFGVLASHNVRANNYRQTHFNYFRTLDLNRFRMVPQGNLDIFGETNYRIPWVIDTDMALLFFEENRPFFIGDTDSERRDSGIWNYDHRERIYAGYGMGSWQVGLLEFFSGIRIEHTVANYEGVVLAYNESDELTEDVKAASDQQYTHLFPNVQISIRPSEFAALKAAYSRTIRRPDANLLSPFVLLEHQQGTLFKGNPDLVPMVADNLDLLTQVYIGNHIQTGVNLFYKQLTNAVTKRSRVLSGGELDGYEERMFINSEGKTDIYGLEIAWQQQLVFLPGWLAGLGLYANYTWTRSDHQDSNRPGEILQLPGQSPHVVNAAMNFSHGRIFTQLMYHWTSEYVSDLGVDAAWAPSLSSTEMVFLDYHDDGASDLSATFQFRISENFHFWANASNLLRSERKRYAYARSLYPSEIDIRKGVIINTGIRYSF